MDAVLQEVRAEAARAAERYGPFTSSHEGLGVLIEEMAELMEAVRANNMGSIRKEAIQVAAVAARLASHCEGHPAFTERSGG